MHFAKLTETHVTLREALSASHLLISAPIQVGPGVAKVQVQRIILETFQRKYEDSIKLLHVKPYQNEGFALM